MQNNNQMLGSPVNRIRITGTWASRSLAWNPSQPFAQRLREYANYIGFRLVMFTIDCAFWASKLRQWVHMKLGQSSEGFEDELERSMRGYAKNTFGVEIADDVFQG